MIQLEIIQPEGSTILQLASTPPPLQIEVIGGHPGAQGPPGPQGNPGEAGLPEVIRGGTF
jgi:hypothetical protein